MRWSSAKAVLIVAFLCLDVFLFWRASLARTVAPLAVRAATATPVRSGGTVQLTAVHYDGVYPTPPPVLPPLGVHLLGPDAAALATDLFGQGFTVHTQGSITTYTGAAGVLQAVGQGILVYHRTAPPAAAGAIDAATARTIADRFWARLGGYPADAAFDGVSYDPATHVYRVAYVQRYQGQPLFPGNLTTEVDQRGVLQATRIWLAVAGAAGPARAVLSPAQALARLVSLLGASRNHPLRVESLLLGYYSNSYPADTTWPTVPAWRVRLTDGSLYYVNAYTGTLEQGAG